MRGLKKHHSKPTGTRTMWRVKAQYDCTLETVEVTKATDKSVWLLMSITTESEGTVYYEQRNARESFWGRYFDDEGDALRYILSVGRQRASDARKELAKYTALNNRTLERLSEIVGGEL